MAHHFSAREDPRSATQSRHKLIEIITIAITAALSGADGWVGVETFAKGKEAWLRSFLELPHGIPSHDCFGRVFALINPQQFAACFRRWSAAVAELIPDELIAVDGKTRRRSHNRGKGLAALHVVSAWATANRVVLGHVATDAKSNEITAIPRLLLWLKREGCILTIDAMGCQTTIAAQIIAQGVMISWPSKATRTRWPPRSRRRSSMPTPATMWMLTRSCLRPSSGDRVVSKPVAIAPWAISLRGV
jgi:hypothetical protein